MLGLVSPGVVRRRRPSRSFRQHRHRASTALILVLVQDIDPRREHDQTFQF